MAKKNKLLNEAAARIGTAMGKANRTAHKLSLKKQLQKTTKRLRKALA